MWSLLLGMMWCAWPIAGEGEGVSYTCERLINSLGCTFSSASTLKVFMWLRPSNCPPLEVVCLR